MFCILIFGVNQTKSFQSASSYLSLGWELQNLCNNHLILTASKVHLRRGIRTVVDTEHGQFQLLC